MILHYELGNYDYFDSLLLSSKRFFKKIDTLDAVEKLFLEFFPAVIACTAETEKKAAFGLLQQALEKLQKNRQLQETYYRNFDLVSWASAHAKGISFAQEVREKYGGIQEKSIHSHRLRPSQ
jgi:hypothetical protein